MQILCSYCQKELTQGCLYQKRYEQVAQQLDVTKFEIYCSPFLTISEQTLFEAFLSPKGSVFEIGCGTFHRTGPYFKKNQISFYGVDPLENVVRRSDYRQHIIVNTFDIHFLEKYKKIRQQEYTAIVLLGGIINGIHCPTLRDSFWRALRILAMNSEVVILDTLTQPQFNFMKSKTGFAFSHEGALPIQYYYSRKELQQIFTTYDFDVAVEGIDIGGGNTRTFVLYGDLWKRNSFFKEN